MKVNGFSREIHVENLICKSLESGRFPHAVVIEGGNIGELENLAAKISRVLLCGNGEDRPCGECPDCIKTSHGLHPDCLPFRPRKEKGSKNEFFSVNYIREIRDSAFIIPNEAEKKIIILSNAETMNIQAQNAFLKILEEPPEFAVFILLCTTKSVFLPTILSRVTVYYAGGTAETGHDPEETEKILKAASAVAEAIPCENDFEIVRAAGVFEKNEKFLKVALPVMAEIFAQALRIRYSVPEDNPYPAAEVLSGSLSARALLKLTECTNELLAALEMNANLNLTITRLCTLFRSATGER